MRHVALYGSLRRGSAQHVRFGLPSALRYVGARMLRGVLYDLGPYPGLKPGDGLVEAELYRIVDARVLERLDRYEGYDPRDEVRSAYVRRVVRVPALATRPAPACAAWVYWYNGSVSGCPPIPAWPPPRRAGGAGRGGCPS